MTDTAALASDLIAHLRAAYAPDVEPDVDRPETTERFVVDDESKACWALRKIAELRAEIARVDAVAAEEIARVEAWRDGLTDKAKRSVAYFEAVLEPYTASRTNETMRTVHLVAGDLYARKSTTVDVLDETALVRWLAAHAPDLIVAKPRIGDLKKALARDSAGKPQPCLADGDAKGDVIPGISVWRGDVYSSKPAPLPTA